MAKQRKGFSIAAFVFGILSIVGFCCCCTNIIFAPLAIIFGIISLIKGYGSKGLSITAIVFAILSIVITVAVLYSFKDVIKNRDVILDDFSWIVDHQDTVFPDYEQRGTIPKVMDKYNTGGKLSDLLASRDIKVTDVMDALDEMYTEGHLKKMITNSSSQDASSLTLNSDDTIPGLPTEDSAILGVTPAA